MWSGAVAVPIPWHSDIVKVTTYFIRGFGRTAGAIVHLSGTGVAAGHSSPTQCSLHGHVFHCRIVM